MPTPIGFCVSQSQSLWRLPFGVTERVRARSFAWPREPAESAPRTLIALRFFVVITRSSTRASFWLVRRGDQIHRRGAQHLGLREVGAGLAQHAGACDGLAVVGARGAGGVRSDECGRGQCDGEAGGQDADAVLDGGVLAHGVLPSRCVDRDDGRVGRKVPTRSKKLFRAAVRACRSWAICRSGQRLPCAGARFDDGPHRGPRRRPEPVPGARGDRVRPGLLVRGQARPVHPVGRRRRAHLHHRARHRHRDRVRAHPDDAREHGVGSADRHRRTLRARARLADPPAHRGAVLDAVVTARGPHARARLRDPGDLGHLAGRRAARVRGRLLHAHAHDPGVRSRSRTRTVRRAS